MSLFFLLDYPASIPSDQLSQSYRSKDELRVYIQPFLIIICSTLMDTMITPLSERADEWRKGGCATGALSREHARECKRARTELRRKVADAQRQARKARRQPTDARRRADVSMQVSLL